MGISTLSAKQFLNSQNGRFIYLFREGQFSVIVFSILFLYFVCLWHSMCFMCATNQQVSIIKWMLFLWSTSFLNLSGMDQKRDMKQNSINFTDVTKANETWWEACINKRDGHKSMSSTMAKRIYKISLFEMKNDEFKWSNVNSTSLLCFLSHVPFLKLFLLFKNKLFKFNLYRHHCQVCYDLKLYQSFLLTSLVIWFPESMHRRVKSLDFFI